MICVNSWSTRCSTWELFYLYHSGPAPCMHFIVLDSARPPTMYSLHGAYFYLIYYISFIMPIYQLCTGLYFLKIWWSMLISMPCTMYTFYSDFFQPGPVPCIHFTVVVSVWPWTLYWSTAMFWRRNGRAFQRVCVSVCDCVLEPRENLRQNLRTRREDLPHEVSHVQYPSIDNRAEITALACMTLHGQRSRLLFERRRMHQGCNESEVA